MTDEIKSDSDWDNWKPSRKWSVGTMNALATAVLYLLPKFGVEDMDNETIFAFLLLANIGISGLSYYISDSQNYIEYRYRKNQGKNNPQK